MRPYRKRKDVMHAQRVMAAQLCQAQKEVAISLAARVVGAPPLIRDVKKAARTIEHSQLEGVKI